MALKRFVSGMVRRTLLTPATGKIHVKQKKLQTLTRIGRDNERRLHIRRDANCPAVMYLTIRNAREHFAINGMVVNISEGGCLITSAGFPWRDDVLDADGADGDDFPRISEVVRVHLPWTETTVGGLIKKQGNHTLRIQFDFSLRSNLVDRIARMTPAK